MNNVITFQSNDDFGAWNAAQRYLEDMGYSYGSPCTLNTVAILKGDFAIAKWKNLTPIEKKNIDGKAVGNIRVGPIVITFYDGHVPEHELIFN